MIWLIPYLLKVAVCSAVLLLYYYVALRNKLFHQWNRFYLLSTIILSISIPCFSFTWFHSAADKESSTIQLLYAVSTGDEYVIKLTRNPSLQALLVKHLPLILYGTVSIVLLVILLTALLRIRKLIRIHTVQQLDDIRFIATDVKGTPFSFFQYLFWNPSISLDTTTGQQIFQHEAAHIREKHTLDKLFVQCILVLFWYNPVFWLIRQELRMLHEFIADKKAVQNEDTAALAAMILQAAYPQQYNSIINPFFNHTIKRRITMLTKIQNPRRSYISRLLLIPVMAVVTLAFTVRTKEQGIFDSDKKITVIIDAGHGGGDAGAQDGGLKEKDLALSLAKQIKAANKNPNIEIVLTRNSDEQITLKDRIAISESNNAELYISLHTNTGSLKNGSNSIGGIEVVVPTETTEYLEKNVLLGSALVKELSSIYTTLPHLLKRNTGSQELQKHTFPYIIIQCGSINSIKDRNFFQEATNQKLVAHRILTGIETYLQSKETTALPEKISSEAKANSSFSAEGLMDKDKKFAAVDTSKKPFKKVDKEASFVGGTTAWRKYLSQTINPVIPIDKGAPIGSYTVMVQFIVGEDGSISDIKPLTKHGYGTEEEVVRIMQFSPNWEPAKVKGRAVASYRKQPVTFVVDEGTVDETVVLKSGEWYTSTQLQQAPFPKLLQPEGNLKMVSAIFSVYCPDKTVHALNINGVEKPERIDDLIKPGNLVVIKSRKALTDMGVETKLPIVYFKVK
jgi:N-acetylmuramoyl-L-alanine amidase